MPLSDRERWLVNFYRNSELHGALLMGRLARTVADPGLLVEMTAHCATEARLDPAIPPIQEQYAAEGGVPGALVDILVLSETLERRVRDSYHRHLACEAPHPAVAETLAAIVAEMDAKHGAEHAGWIEQALGGMAPGAVEAARRKWQDVDSRVSSRIRSGLDERFGAGPVQP
jgi:hypothetical protein